jgi:hypothetical protein
MNSSPVSASRFLFLLFISFSSANAFAAEAPKGEPTNASEAEAQRIAAEKKAAAAAALQARYESVVSMLSEEEQAWERTLQKYLGGFYLPLHQADKVAGRSNAWDFVKDDPRLPRVLLIGDSVSRGYTLAARAALAGKANVHRAPENCGGTQNGVKKIDAWLGEGKWDVIHFNFGLHDRGTAVADYAQRLEHLVERLKATGAKLVWATTTPVPDEPEKKQLNAAVIERNKAAADLMSRNGVWVDDLYEAVLPRLEALQNPKDIHFKPEGYQFLGERVAESISAALKK